MSDIKYRAERDLFEQQLAEANTTIELGRQLLKQRAEQLAQAQAENAGLKSLLDKLSDDWNTKHE